MDSMSEMGRGKETRWQDDRIAPSEVELIKYRDNRTVLIVNLLNGDILEGAIRWYDALAMRLVRADRTEVTIYMRAIAYYQTRA